MRDLAVLILRLLVTAARLAGPGGARAVVAESVVIKHQLLEGVEQIDDVARVVV